MLRQKLEKLNRENYENSKDHDHKSYLLFCSLSRSHGGVVL